MERRITWWLTLILILVVTGCDDELSNIPIESTPKIVKGLSGDTYFNTKFGIKISNLPVDEWTVKDLGTEGQGMLVKPEQGFINLYLLLLMECVPANQFVGPDEAGTLAPVIEANIPFIGVVVDYERGVNIETHDLAKELDRYATMWSCKIGSKKPIYVGKYAAIQAILFHQDGGRHAETWFAKGGLTVRCWYWAKEPEFVEYFDVYMKVVENIWLMGK